MGSAGPGFEPCVAYLAAALLQERARAVEPQRNHGDDAPAGGGGIGGEAREVLWGQAEAIEHLVRVRVRARVRSRTREVLWRQAKAVAPFAWQRPHRARC